MIINEFRNIPEDPFTLLNICRKCGPKINPCDNIYEALTVNVSAGPAQGHSCNRAIFDAFILDYLQTQELGKNVWRYIRRTNFNNRPPPAGQGSQVTYDIELTQELVQTVNAGKEGRESCCILDLKLVPGPWPAPITLPYESVEPTVEGMEAFGNGIYLPPIGQESIQIGTRTARSVHNNIVRTTITRVSDGVVLATPFQWQGEQPINLCLGFDDPDLSRDPFEIVL